jgi:ubiquinone biosynthesis UbiH/UbiF/VisC/COQ6 family hydroxylase
VVLQLSNHQTVAAQLLVAADGVHSWVRQQANITTTFKNFNQTAVVANFKVEKSHGNIARQWFAPHETMALLPLPQQMVALVWSVSTEKAGQLLTGTTGALAQSVLEQSQGILGELTPVSNSQAFPLAQQTAQQMIAERIVLVGDAGHQIHPMAGQGVNLGFRDVMELATLTTNTHAMMDIGDHGFLRRYERARKTDTLMMNSLTSGLDYLFAEQQPYIKQLTHWGFNQLKSQQNIKRFLIQQAAA